MTNLLLITDVPRLRKIFSRLADERDIRLRVANSLEKGGEEIVAEKPDVVFVQTHLSGLSGDILLMHLKKQLGRRRSRFVLLGSAENISPDVLKIYHGHIDTSLTDNPLFDVVRETVETFSRKTRKSAETAVGHDAAAADQPSPAVTMAPDEVPEPVSRPDIFVPLQLESLPDPPEPEQIPVPELSLEEQGITYTPKPRLSVYSEFTSSFESAVSSMQPSESFAGPEKDEVDTWLRMEAETVESTPTRSKRVNFLLWFAPVLIAVIVVTIVQNRISQPKSIDVAPAAQTGPVLPAKKSMPAVAPAQVSSPVPASAVKAGVAEPDARLGDRAVLSAIAENRERKEQVKPASPALRRPTSLPDFIPRYGADKTYSAANPGWERYRGQVTEFKVYRESGSIKAIQVVDRGGQGVPESFMRGVLRQLTRKPVFVMESSEKKDGYDIQRGQIAEHLKAVYYRDADGGRLRAFVVTWQ